MNQINVAAFRWDPVSPIYTGIAREFLELVLLLPFNGLIAIASWIEILRLYRKPHLTRKLSASIYIKLLVSGATTLILAVELALLNEPISSSLRDVKISTLMQFVASSSILILGFLQVSRRLITDDIILIYWLVTVLFNSMKINAVLLDPGYQSLGRLYSILHCILTSCSLVSLCAESLISLPKPTSSNRWLRSHSQNPYECANLFSKVTFGWMTPLIKLGYQRDLTEKDLPDIPTVYESESLIETLEDKWNKQLTSKHKPFLLLAFFEAFGRDFIVGIGFKVCRDILSFVQPQLMRRLILVVDTYNTPHPDSLFRGLLIAFSMFIFSTLQFTLFNQYSFRANNTIMKIFASGIGVVYRKAMRLSSQSKSDQNTGSLVNLISVDIDKVCMIPVNAQVFISTPLQIALSMISLYSLVGHAMWAAAGILVLLLPINTILSRKRKAIRRVLMKHKDKRMRVSTEIFTNIKSIKLYGWEIPFLDKLNHIRNVLELGTFKRRGYLSVATGFIWTTAPFLVSSSTLALFVIIYRLPLTADIVFPALTLFNMLRTSLSSVPSLVTTWLEASVSIKRITTMLTLEENDPNSVERLSAATVKGQPSVGIKKGTFYWELPPIESSHDIDDEQQLSPRPILKDINFTARKGELTCIVGRVGSGKSSLLGAILGDLYKSQGSVYVRGSIAYAAQMPWVLNATIKNNILFGRRYEPEFYEETIRACALVDDFKFLPDGDETEVGEKGISLSGGQKARVALARAVYTRADVYVFDDILSAVDKHVGRHMIDNVLGPNGLLKSKTRILATNAINVLADSDFVYLLQKGKIVESASFADIVTGSAITALSTLIRDYGEYSFGNQENTISNPSPEEIKYRKIREREAEEIETYVDDFEERGSTSSMPMSSDDEGNPPLNRTFSYKSARRPSLASVNKYTMNSSSVPNRKTERRAEELETGKVKWSVYLSYAKAANPYYIAVFLVFLLATQTCSVGSNFWLKHWAEMNSRNGRNLHFAKYIGVYLLFGLGSTIFRVCYSIISKIFCAVFSASFFHSRMANAVMRSPLSFFETTPIGRILNRFSNDISTVDDDLPETFQFFFANTLSIILTIGVITYTTPAFFVVVIPLALGYFLVQKYYIRSSRQLSRLKSATSSPVYAHFNESLTGVTTIRAFGMEDRFAKYNDAYVDLSLMASFIKLGSSRWLNYRLSMIGALTTLGASSLAVVSVARFKMAPADVGLSLTYAMSIVASLNSLIRMTVDVENEIVSVERMLQYIQLPGEAPFAIRGHRPPAFWPPDGEIEFKDFGVRYRENLDLVLKHINLLVKPQEKVGIVGRTGAGKSTLTMGLFRVIEASEGAIFIDHVDISTIGLHDLRHNLSIIPQDAQAFEGTIRSNLDPLCERDDTDLWRALQLSHLLDFVSSLNEGLDSKVQEGGRNMSAGQRQLMCLARALLIPSHILVLDEATSAVDVETDALIQRTIRREFADRTILTIAHRINTIMDSDRVVVLDQGSIKEIGEPSKLASNPESLFYGLCKEGN